MDTPQAIAFALGQFKRQALLFVALILLVIAGFSLWPRERIGTAGNLPHGTDIFESARSGDSDKALAQFRQVMADPSASQERVIAANFAAFIARIHTPDPIEPFAAIRDLKNIIADPSVPLRKRAGAINLLASAYNESGRRKEIAQEIFKDQPYSTYTERGASWTGSVQSLLLWGYSVYPTPRTAYDIAVTYVGDALRLSFPQQSIPQEGRPKIGKAEAIQNAEIYLKRGDEIRAAQLAADPSTPEDEAYVAHHTWRTYVIGMLAYFKGAPYKDQYRKEFEEYFTFMASERDNLDSLKYLPMMRWVYASLLLQVDSDSAAAKAQLDALMQLMRSNPSLLPDLSATIRMYKGYSDPSYWTDSSEKLAALSPEFKAFYESIK